MADARHGLDADGPAAPPRANGELVFEAPWESRVFGLTLALCERGTVAWEDFRRRLLDEIRRWEREHPSGEPYRYYERWLAALETLLAERSLCETDELDALESALAARPAGHDHPHPHSHDHD